MNQSIRSEQIRDGEVKRQDLCTTEATESVIAKVIAGSNIEITETGEDAGTGDVTINVTEVISLPEQASAPTEETGKGKLYTKEDGLLYYLTPTGVEQQIYVGTQTFSVAMFISAPADGTVTIGRNMPFAGTIKSITTKTSSGTCTVTGKISGVNLGGTANSASSSESTQTHSSANAFSIGDDIEIAISSSSTPSNLAITVEYSRNLIYINSSTETFKFCMSFFINSAEDKTYRVIGNIPFAGTVKKITTKTSSGTCTVTGKINGSSLGGTANSATSSEQEQSHSSSNTFSSGDDIDITVSSNSSATNLAVTIEYERSMIGV